MEFWNNGVIGKMTSFEKDVIFLEFYEE